MPTDVGDTRALGARRARERLGVERRARSSTTRAPAGLNAVITRRAAEGRVPDDRRATATCSTSGASGGRWRRSPTRRGGGPSATPPAARAPLPAPRHPRADHRRRQVLIALDEAQARAELEVLARCERRGRRDLPAQRLRRPTPTSSACASSSREVLGRRPLLDLVARSRRSRKEYARASTTVVDVFMKLDLRRVRRAARRRAWRELGFDGRAQLRRLRGDADAVPSTRWSTRTVVFAGPAAGTVAQRPLRRAASATSNLLCADVGGTSCDISVVTDGQPFVNTTFELEHDLLVNALVDRDRERSAPAAAASSASARRGEIRVGPDERRRRPRAGLLRPGRHRSRR